MRWLDGIIDGMDMNLGKLWEVGRDRKAWRAAVHGHKGSDMTELPKNNIEMGTSVLQRDSENHWMNLEANYSP